MDVDICGLEHIEYSLESIKDRLNAQNRLIDYQNKILKALVDLIDYQMHLDYQNKTGRKLVTPFDVPEATMNELQRANESQMRQIMYNFIEANCERGEDQVISASTFNGKVQEYFRYNGYAAPLAAEIEDYMEYIGPDYHIKLVKGNHKRYIGVDVKYD